MIEVEARIEIERPADQIWAIVADYARDPEWRGGVRTMRADPAGPVRAGTRTDECLRFAGRTLRNAGEVLSVGPGLRFAWRTTAGADADGSREVVALGDARCRLALRLRVRPRGLARVTAPLASRNGV